MGRRGPVAEREKSDLLHRRSLRVSPGPTDSSRRSPRTAESGCQSEDSRRDRRASGADRSATHPAGFDREIGREPSAGSEPRHTRPSAGAGSPRAAAASRRSSPRDHRFGPFRGRARCGIQGACGISTSGPSPRAPSTARRRGSASAGTALISCPIGRSPRRRDATRRSSGAGMAPTRRHGSGASSPRRSARKTPSSVPARRRRIRGAGPGSGRGATEAGLRAWTRSSRPRRRPCGRRR